MTYIKGQSRKQIILLPDCIDDLIGQDNPVRVIDAFVDSLNIEEAGFQRSKPNITGRPAYDPRDLLKLYVYGYFNKIRSSRRLMMECSRNVELFYLLNRLIPDFRTISDFRKDNARAIRNVFRAFVKLCLKLNLYQKELLAIDGSKFRAVNSKQHSSFNKGTLEKKLARIDENILRFLSQMDEADNLQQTDSKYTPEEIKAAIAELNNRKEKYTGYLKELNESGENQKLTTDPEARVMQSKDGFHCSYNVQTAIDKGYESRKDIENCVMNGIIPNVAFKYDKDERLYAIDYEENDISEAEKHSTKPEDIQKCIKAGVLPSCYENTAIEVELQEKTVLSCFTLNEDRTVTCPMGHILSKTKVKGQNTIYANKDACRQCLNKCTSSKTYKTVSFGPGTRYVPVYMYGRSKYGLNPIPEDITLNPFNHTLDRKNHITKKVVLHIKGDDKKIKERMCLSEHPFGTVKWHHGAHYLLCKGKEKATAELGLSFLAYNLKRAINLVGIQKLMAAI